MKNTFILLISLLFSIQLFAGSGGPDLFGYTWKDSYDTAGPSYNWINIVNSERRVWGLGDDNIRGPFNIAHHGTDLFTYYWYPVDKFWIGSNGYISFGSINLSSAFPTIPDSTDQRHNFISGLLADLTFVGTGNPAECYYHVTADSVIISFINVPFYSQYAPSWTGSNTFQIILDKVNNSIQINFQSSTGTTMNGDIRTGMENISGNIGLQPFVNTYPAAGYAIKYYYPTTPTYFVSDGAAVYNSQIGSGGHFLPYPGIFDLHAKIANTGNLDIIPPFTATGKVKNQAGTAFVNSPVSFADTLHPGQDTIFQYPAGLFMSAAGTYTYTTRISNISGDAVPSNDSVMQELIAIDTSSSSMTLNYTDGMANTPGISWVDGTGGLGMYLVPPYYPVKITATQFFIESNISGASFAAKILDDDGPNGTPGTLLDSVFVNSSSIFVGGYNTVVPANHIVLYSGGVYVGWEMWGTDITLGKDTDPPISYRSYEFIYNIWSEYRTSQSEDFLIGMTVTKHHYEDIGVSSIVSPLNNAVLGAPTPVTVWIKNYGQQAESVFDVNYKVHGEPIITETYTGTPIAVGDSVQFTFAIPIAIPYAISGPFIAYTTKPNDASAANDTATINLTILTNIKGEQIDGGMLVQPNPVRQMAIIHYPNPTQEMFEFRVYDLKGRCVHAEGGITGPKVLFNAEGLEAGFYILEMKGRKKYVQKVIVQ